MSSKLPSPQQLRQRLRQALARREAIARDRTDCFRAVHSHADGVPDVTVDAFDGGLIVISTYSELAAEEEMRLGEACAEVLEARSVYLKRRPREARHVANVAARDVAPVTPLLLQPLSEVTGLENGLRYRIRPNLGLSVGLFLDMRDTRAWVRERVKDKTVLNCFAYTCAFSVAARAGGAARVANIDVSRRVLDWGVENHALNGFTADQRDFIAGDVFDWLGRFAKKSEQFDVVIVDPPSFANTTRSRFSAARDYPKLVRAALGVVAPQGTLICCCNLAQLDDAAFAALVDEGFAQAGRRAGRRARLGASEIDFPPHPKTPHRLNILVSQT